MQRIKKLIARVKGFTLIELLVVIAIIGILSSSVIISTNTARKKARDARRLADLRQIANAMEIYIDSNNGKYPDSLEVLAPNYIAVLPKDPLTKTGYFYCSNGTPAGTDDGTTFHLAAAMEEYNPLYFDSDADLEVDGCENLTNNPSFNGYSEACSDTQKCNGENCDGCLDFSNIVTPGTPGGDTGGDGNTGGNGGGNGGDNNSGNNTCSSITGGGDNNSHWNINVAVPSYNNAIGRISWTPPAGQGTRYTTYTVHTTGEFWENDYLNNPANPPRYVDKENIIQMSAENNFVEIHNLKPGSTYSFYVEAMISGYTRVEASENIIFSATTECGNHSCDAGENCSKCSIDCAGATDYPPTAPTSVGLTVSTSYNANIYWSPAEDKEGPVTYIVHTIGYLFDKTSSPWTWKEMERKEAGTSDPYKIEELYPHHTYTFFIEAVDGSGKSSESARVSWYMKSVCPDGSCDDGEFCFTCQRDCGTCPQPLEFYQNDPYFKQFFPK